MLLVRQWVVFVGMVAGLCSAGMAGEEALRHGSFVDAFSGDKPVVTQTNPNIDCDIPLAGERFFIHVPAGYDGSEPYGLIVFLFSGDEFTELPSGWNSVLARRRLLFVAPQKVGNDQRVSRRLGLAVLGAMKMIERYKVDPQRVYASGLSGGSRMAGIVTFLRPDLFHGTIQNCGADFYEAVPHVYAKPTNPGDAAYGVFTTTADVIEQAKKNARFVLITGTKDFRYGYLRDIYEGGFAKAGFQATLIDVPGMDHEICSGAVLTKALAFLDEGKQSVAATLPAATTQKAAWAAKDPAKWPQIVLNNEMRRKDGVAHAGSAFLMRLPNGAIVSATARHCVGKELPLDQIASTIQVWTVYPPGIPDRGVQLRKLAMKTDQRPPLDCVLMTVVKRAIYPAEVLNARQTPLEPLEPLYLIGWPSDGKGAQAVYKTTFRQLSQDGEILYDLPANVKTTGFSGAPVVDGEGRVVGLHLGHATMNGAEFLRALPIGAMLAVADAPEPVHVAADAASPASRPANPAIKTPSASDRAAVAAQAVSMAKSYIEIGQYDKARARLQLVLDTYKDTPAAADAKELVREIQGR